MGANSRGATQPVTTDPPLLDEVTAPEDALEDDCGAEDVFPLEDDTPACDEPLDTAPLDDDDVDEDDDDDVLLLLPAPTGLVQARPPQHANPTATQERRTVIMRATLSHAASTRNVVTADGQRSGAPCQKDVQASGFWKHAASGAQMVRLMAVFSSARQAMKSKRTPPSGGRSQSVSTLHGMVHCFSPP